MDKTEEKSKEMDPTEILDSQVPETELQSSCETLMSQQSENQKLCEKPVGIHDEDKSADTSACNSSLEANRSGGSSYNEKTSSENLEKVSPEKNTSVINEGIEGERKRDAFEGKEDQKDSSFTKHQIKKRKGRSGDSTPSPKRLRRSNPTVSAQEENHSSEPDTGILLEDTVCIQDESVLEISSTPEITIEDSQEFSLRIEESSPPTTQCSGEKTDNFNSQKGILGRSSREGETSTDISPAVSMASPTHSIAPVSLSQKSTVSWSSHTQNLSWGSHKDFEHEKNFKEENGEHVDQLGDSEKNSTPDSIIGKNADNMSVREVTETRTCPFAVVITWVIDNNSKVISGKIKQLSLLEEHHVEKPGRMSTVSTTSTKSSSSTGSVGLPGPFPLPGKTVRSRLSTVSTVSSTTSSSSASNQAWDGPFLKPQVPGSKLNVPFTCEKCGHHFPPVDRHVSFSPILNGSPPAIIEEEEPEVKTVTPKRGRRPQGNNSGSTVSSGLLDEETSSSGSQAPPQASSTPAKQPRGRPRREAQKQNGTTHKSVKKEVHSSIPARSPRTVGRGSKNGMTASTRKVEEGKGRGEAVLARWGGDGCYYPGWVTEPLSSAQVVVHFCDGQSKPTAPGKVVRADVITPGTLVLAATRTGEYEEALVIRVDSEGAEPVYTVERDKNQRRVEFASIAVQQSTVTELTVSEAQKQVAATNFNDLSLENIIAHPRKRSARTPVEGGSGRKKKRLTTPPPCTSHGRTYNGPDETHGDTDSSTHSTCSLDLRGKEIRPLDVECFPPESLKTKLVYSRGHMAFKKKEGNTTKVRQEDLVLYGPIPEPGSKLFTDCVFLITYTESVKLKVELELNTSDANGTLQSSDTLWRNRLRTQIINGGGKVYNSFSEVTKDELPNTYLITDKQCNTPLYLQCLVNSIPIYSHCIVIQCCVQNRTWREMIASRGVKRMMAGYSLARGCLVNPRSLTPLRGRTLLLALSGDPSLSTFWQRLVTKAGGSVHHYPHTSLEATHFDAVVTDAECDRELVAEACSLRLPLVSTTWLQQVIITGEWRSPTEHPLYKYNAVGNGEGESPEY